MFLVVDQKNASCMSTCLVEHCLIDQHLSCHNQPKEFSMQLTFICRLDSQGCLQVVCQLGEHQHHRCSLCEHLHTCVVKLKHNGIWGWGIYGFNGWDIYDSNGWNSYGKVCFCFFGRYAQKILDFRGVPFPVITWPWVSVPLNSQSMAYYRKGGTTPRLRLALSEEPSSQLSFTQLWIF